MTKRNYRIGCAAILLAATLSLTTATQAAPAENATIAQINYAFVAAASKASPAVVTILSERVVRNQFHRRFSDFWGDDSAPERESRGTVLGSGVIFDSGKGYMVTNNHVVEDAEEIRVRLYDHREVPAEIVGTDPLTDLAVIKVSVDDLIQVQLGNSEGLRVGEWVLAIGSPFSQNLEHTITAGIVSAIGRSTVMRRGNYEDFIQTDAAINPGNSGGALVTLDGKLIGINTAIATDGFSRSNSGVGFAIPINLVKRIVGDLIEDGKVTRALLGVLPQNLDAPMAKALKAKNMDGALVITVMEGTAAERAGIKEQDLILKVDDITIRDAAHLRNLISSSRPGDRRRITIVRKGKEKIITVKLGELEPAPIAARDVAPDDDSDVFDRTGFAVAGLDGRAAQRFDIPAESGVVVIRVERYSQAARGGIEPGDVVVQIGNDPIKNMRDYRKALKSYKKGDTVLLRVAKGDGFRFVGIELG